MADRVVLQKLLTADLAAALVDDGHDRVGGYVTLAADVADLRTPASLLEAHGFGGRSPEFVDVVRFALPPAATLSKPSETPERSWPTYPAGFLRGAVPVWLLARTRYSYGAEYWRIRADGEQRCLASYDGCARGWRGAHGWQPPSRMVGTRARWREDEYAADVVGDGVLLTAGGEVPPADLADAGAQEIRPGVWTAAVPLDECEVFEAVITATVHGVRVRVLDSDGATARVELVSDDPAEAQRIGAELVEPDVHQATLPVADLSDTGGVLNELVPGRA
jgi:hypothetical protein